MRVPDPRAGTAYVALLRGINVGGHRKVGMSELRALIESAGFEDVTTYVQSGNVVFRPAIADGRALAALIEDRIARELGLDVAVLVRSAADLDAIVGHRAFDEELDPRTRHVTFLADAPARGRVEAIDPDGGLPDRFRVAGLEVHLHCPGGYGRTKLNNAFFERALGVATTTRSWRTVLKLAELTNT